MICPACSNDFTPEGSTDGGVAICPHCARTLMIEGYSARIAVADDTVRLDPQKLADLRRQRTTVKRSL